MSKSNNLSDAEEERLEVLAEECAEVIQAICKIQRHGYASYNPFNDTLNNRQALEKELGHVQNAVRMMTAAKDLNQVQINVDELLKRTTIGQWLHHQGDPE